MTSHKMRRLAVFTACFLIVLVSYCIRYSYGVLLPEMLPSLEISKTEAGVIYASFFIAYTIFSPVLGLLGDRMDIRWLLTIFTVLLGAGTFLMAFSSSVLVASLFFTIVGVGASATWVPVMALAQKWAPDRHRGLTLAVIDIGSAFSLILVSTVLPRIVVTHSWQYAWMTLGGLAFILAIINYFMVRNPPVKATQETARPSLREFTNSIRDIYAGLLGNARLWFIGLAYLLTGFAVMVPLTFMVTYAAEELTFTYAAAARLTVIIGAGAIAGKVILGYLSDRISRKIILIICGLFIAVGCAGITWTSNYVVIFIFTIIFGAGYGAVWPMYAACAADYFPREYSGMVVGLWTLFLGIGLTLSPIVAGWLADIFGSLEWSFIAAGAGGLISIVFLLPLRRVKPGDTGPYQE